MSVTCIWMSCKQCVEFLPCSVGEIAVRVIIDGLKAVFLLCLCVYVNRLLTSFFFDDIVIIMVPPKTTNPRSNEVSPYDIYNYMI